MSFARSEIAHLVERVSAVPVERDASRKLSFLLLDPFFGPLFPEEICARPELLGSSHSFPSHLACGLLDNSLEYRRNAERFEFTRRFFRKLAALGPLAPEPMVFLHLPERIERSYWELLQGYLAAERLCEQPDLTNLELSVLAENVLLALARQTELLGLLMKHRLCLLQHLGRTRFQKRLLRAAEEGIAQPPLDPAELYTDHQAPIRFSAQNMADDDFVMTAKAPIKTLSNAMKESLS